MASANGKQRRWRISGAVKAGRIGTAKYAGHARKLRWTQRAGGPGGEVYAHQARKALG